MGNAEFFERVGEWIVADVVQQRSRADDTGIRTRNAIELLASSEHVECLAGKVICAECMLES